MILVALIEYTLHFVTQVNSMKVGSMRSKVNGTTLAVEPSAETVAWMQEKWEALVTPKTGLKDYAEMLAAWQKEQWDLKMEKEHINTLLGASHS